MIDQKYYKTYTILFQTIFDIQILGTYPRSAFFPPHSSKSTSKNVRFMRVSIIYIHIHTVQIFIKTINCK